MLKQAVNEQPMSAPIEKTIADIDFSMSMENMPLTEQDKSRLRDCLTGKADVHEVLRQTIERHTSAFAAQAKERSDASASRPKKAKPRQRRHTQASKGNAKL